MRIKSIFDLSAIELRNVDKATFEYLVDQGNKCLHETVQQASMISQRSYTVMAFVFAFYSFAMNSLISDVCIYMKIYFICIFVVSLILLFLAAIPYKIMPSSRPPKKRNMTAYLMKSTMSAYHYFLAAELITIQKDIDSNNKTIKYRSILFTSGLLLFFISYIVIVIYSILV